MLRSMTGFGKGEAENRRGRVYIEIKALNHKYFDIITRIPLGLHVFEDMIKARVQRSISRGRINLSLDYEDFTRKEDNSYVDAAVAHRYVKRLRTLKKSLRLSGDVTVQQIISMPGVIAYKPQKLATKNLWPLVKKALARAIKQLSVSKEEEGRMLKKHLLNIGKKIDSCLNAVKRHSAERKKRYKSKLVANIKSITGAKDIRDREKLEEEAAIFIRNSDISEEVCRIDAHIKAFRSAVSNHKEVGRRLDFIAQEISREANTIGAKANNFYIARDIIKIKSLVEKIREQTQNVE